MINLARIREALDEARAMRPYRGHLAMTRASYDTVLELAAVLETSTPETLWRLDSLQADSVDVVIDPSVPDGEIVVRALGET